MTNMPTIDITEYDSPNFSERGATISGVVVHNTDSSFNSALNWLCNPAAKASCHLIIGRDGRVACPVSFKDKAWHAGNSRVNATTIGIEIEATRNQRGMTPIQEEKLIAWLKYFMNKYNFKKERIITHWSVVPTDCPKWVFPTENDFNEWKKEKL